MNPLTEAQIRASFINASKRERAQALLPEDFSEIDWSTREFLGWRDRKLPQVGYVVCELEDEIVGIMLRQAEARARTRPQCAWCEDVTLPNDVAFYVAKRAGAAGRNGDTIGIRVCENFECPVNVRRLPPIPYPGFDREAGRQQRIQVLGEHVRAFVREVHDSD